MYRKHSISIILFWTALLLLSTSGCKTLSFMANLVNKDVYHRSTDYVVYKLKPGDTTASVAQKFLGDASKSWMVEDANNNLTPDNWIVVPLKLPNIGGIYSNGVQKVPILCYHQFAKVGNACSSPQCLPADIFERQMKYLKDNGYHVISPEQLIAFLEYRQSIPKKSVMITIDDGYRSAYTIAYPILKKYGYQATLFVYTGFIGISSKAITWKQLRELKSNGFSIGSHTMYHSDLSKQLDAESKEDYKKRLRREIKKSKQIIDKKLSQDTYLFAYPFGRLNRTVSKMTKQAGYKLAVTNGGQGNSFYTNPYHLSRNLVMEKDIKIFRKRLKIFRYASLR
jgi:peptidoglycan/xylan/chitin deacetylase (PgdA/CDA1 family)